MAGPCLIEYKGKWYERKELAKHLRDVVGIETIAKELKSKASRKPISPEESSNYANLTEDSDGNFVFFHVGGKDYETINKSTGKTLATGGEEAAALGRAGGAAMYYTRPEDSETMVKGERKYAVKIPKDKVYDFNSDPENLIEEARARFKEENPDIAFSPNDQLAYMTKIAGEKGYDMVVAEWNGKTRAQTTTEFKPSDVEKYEGTIVREPFKEKYESNTDKGYEPIIPETKDQKLKEVYKEINKERNSQNKYDKLYRLNETSENMEQSEITKMIEESDISQELKDKYNEALNYKEEKRRSFKYERTDNVKIDNAPKGNYLNIGLNVGTTEELLSKDNVLSMLPKDVKVLQENVKDVKSTINGKENIESTLSVKLSRPLTDLEMSKLLRDTQQKAIPQMVDGEGAMHGTKEWGDFNSEYFDLPNGERLSDVTSKTGVANAIVNRIKKTIQNVFGKSDSDVITLSGEEWNKAVEEAKKGENVNFQAWGGFEKKGFEESPEWKSLIKDGKVRIDFTMEGLEGKPVVVINPDNMLTGEVITKNGESIINGNGGINFVTKFGDVWASSDNSTANTLAKYINEARERDIAAGGDGKVHVVVTKGDLSKSLTSHTGAKAAMKVLEHLVDKKYISLSDFRKALTEVGKKYGINFDGRMDAKSIHDDISKKFFGVTDSTFSKRGFFVQDVIDHLAKNSTSAKDNIEKIRELLNTEELPKSSDRKSGKISFAKEGIVDAIGHLLSDSMTVGVKNSEVYATIEISHPVEVFNLNKEEGGHESYPFHLRQIDEKGNKVTPVLNVLKEPRHVTELLNDSNNSAVDKKGGATKFGSNQIGMAKGFIKSEIPGTETKFMTDSKGEVYGFEQNGKIFLNGEKINPNSPIHEAGHIWSSWAEQNRPDLHEAGLSKVENSTYLKEVKNNKFYQEQASKLSDAEKELYYKKEALAKAIGDNGEKFATETQKSSFKEWISSMWRAVVKEFGIRDMSAEDVSKLTIDEFGKKVAADIFAGKPLKKTSEIEYNGKTYFKNEKGNWVNSATGNEIKGLGPKGKELIKNLEDMLHPETPINKEKISDVKEIETLGKIHGGTVSWEKSVEDAMNTLKSEAKENESIDDVAERKINEWGSRIEKEISEIGKSKFNPTEEDLATMSYYRTKLHDQLNSLSKDIISTDKITQENALKKSAEISQKILNVDYVLLESGKVGSRSFYIRQMIAKMDSEGGMVLRRMDIIRSQGGEPLTKEQEIQLSKIQAEEKELSKDYDKLAIYSQEDFDAELSRRLKDKVKENKSERINKKLTESGKELADKIRKAKLSKDGLRTDLSLGAYDAAIEAIATLVENGAKLGDAIKNVLKMPEYKDIDENKLIKSILGGIDKKDILDNIKSDSKDSLSKVSIAKGRINKLVDSYIDEGLKGKELFDQMNSDLKEIYPTITEQQVRDAFLKTGEFKLESKKVIDADKAEAKSALNGIAKLESQLEKIKENKVKEKNPVKRRKLTDEEADLRKKLDIELKKRGIENERSSSKEVQVKKQLAKSFNDNVDSIIKTIDEEIESGNLSKEEVAHLNKVKSDIESTKVNENTSEKIDNAVDRGIKKLDQVKIDVAGSDVILNKITDVNIENRVDSLNNEQDVLLSRHKTNLERKIKVSEDKITNGEFEEKPRTQRLKTDVEAIKLEMKAKAIDTKYRRMRDIAAQKKMKWWEKGLSLGQSFLVNELIGGLGTSINVATSGLTKQPLNTLTEATFGLAAHTLFPELSKKAGAEGKTSLLKEQQRYRAHYAKIGPEGMKKIWAKSEENVKKAEENYKSNPTEKNKEKLRNALVAQQSNFIYEWIGSDAWKDSADVFLKGSSTLEEIVGKGEKVGWKNMTGLEKTEMIMGAMGASHGYFKNFSARAEFAASFVSRLEQKSKLGIDISDPNVVIETINESLVNYEMGKYQEDNYATSALKSIGQVLANPKNPKWEKYGKASAALFKAKYPIVRTGVNIGREAIQEYLFGSIFGSALHGKTVVKGIFKGVKNSESIKQSIAKEIKTMPSSEVDLIFRCYRKGGLGLVLVGLAAMGYIRFGGFKADKDRKRKEGELAQGDLELFGHNLGHGYSKPLTHLSVTYPALIVANNNRIMAKEGEDIEKVEKSVTSNVSSMLRTIPVFNEGMSVLYSPSVPYGRAFADISKMYDTNRKGELIERDKSSVKNRFLQNIGLRKLTPLKESSEDNDFGQRTIR